MRASRLLPAFLAAALVLGACGNDDNSATDSDNGRPTSQADNGDSAASATSGTAAATTTTTPPLPADQTVLERTDRITGDLSPKSVVASGSGLVSAQNMMYTHTVSVFRSDGSLAATIPDSVDLSAFGIDGHPGVSQGAPVEAAYTSDGQHAYVSNYSMYGQNFGPEGTDDCTPDSGYDDSFVYRIDMERFEIDQVIPVGSVPKYVAVTPDDSTVLVTNWCTWDLSIIDAATAREVRRVPIGRYPRGIAVSPDGSTAYIAVMGGDVVSAVDLASGEVRSLGYTGDGPRHIVISPDGRTLYVTHNHSGTVVSLDIESDTITHSVTTGVEPRSMAISTDGTALYVVNYESSSVSKLAADDLSLVGEVSTDYHPIGITYEPTTRSVWVACYGGSILVFADTTAR